LFKDLFNSKQILATNRYAWIDYVRGICIILVCYRHCFEGLKESSLPTQDYPFLEILNVCFYSFRMPLFFIVSGLFVTSGLFKKGIGKYVGHRFNIIFYPLLIWGSIQITLQLLLRDYVNAKPALTDYINLVIFPRNPNNNQQFWYLNTLFFVGAFYAFFKGVLKFKLWQQMALSILLYVIASYWNYNDITFYIFPDVFHHYIYFCLGDLFSNYILNKENQEKFVTPKWLWPSVLMFIAVQSVFTIVNIQHAEDNFINHKMPWLYLIISLAGCAFVIQLGFVLQQAGVLKWLRVLGYHSLYIYLMHLMIIAAVRIFILKVLGVQSVYLILAVAMIAGVLLPVIVYNIAMRFSCWWLFTFKKPQQSTVPANNKKVATA
jgi:fucose 4-O-acetylase-like acetyltransferase